MIDWFYIILIRFLFSFLFFCLCVLVFTLCFFSFFCVDPLDFDLRRRVAMRTHPRNSAHEDYTRAAASLYVSQIMWFLEDAALMCEQRNARCLKEDGAEWRRWQSGGKEKGSAACSRVTVLASLGARGSPETFTKIIWRNKEEVKLWGMTRPICLIRLDSRLPVQPTHILLAAAERCAQARYSEHDAHSCWGEGETQRRSRRR